MVLCTVTVVSFLICVVLTYKLVVFEDVLLLESVVRAAAEVSSSRR